MSGPKKILTLRHCDLCDLLTFLILWVDISYNRDMAVIVDIDDTLLRYGNRPIRRTIEYVNSLDEEIIIITGRYSTRKNETVRALRSAGLKFSRIFMRPVGDGESNSIPFKKKKAAELKSRISISMAIDNDANARAAYRSLGIKSINPASLPVIQ